MCWFFSFELKDVGKKDVMYYRSNMEKFISFVFA
jgi:hypothetical protein